MEQEEQNEGEFDGVGEHPGKDDPINCGDYNIEASDSDFTCKYEAVNESVIPDRGPIVDPEQSTPKG